MKGSYEVTLPNGKVISFPNTILVNGKSTVLNQAFKGTAAVTWYMGMIAYGPAPTAVTSDSLTSHPGWAEVADGISGGRQALTWDSATDTYILSTLATFPLTAAVDIGGLFICTCATLATGVIFSAVTFDKMEWPLADFTAKYKVTL